MRNEKWEINSHFWLFFQRTLFHCSIPNKREKTEAIASVFSLFTPLFESYSKLRTVKLPFASASEICSPLISSLRFRTTLLSSWFAWQDSTWGRASIILTSLAEQPPQCIPSTFMLIVFIVFLPFYDMPGKPSGWSCRYYTP